MVLVSVVISLSIVHGYTNNSSYIYSDNLSSNNSDNKTSYIYSDNLSSNNSYNKTSYNGTLDNNYNQTTIGKYEENKTIAHDKKEPINGTATKSRVVIRKYVKPKNTPGFDSTMIVLVIMTIIICISARKR